MTSRTHMPPTRGLFLMFLLPVAAYGYPEIFDWRFAGLAGAACAAGTVIARRLAAPPWLALWAGYSVAVAAPRTLFHFLAGDYATPVSWTPFWSGGPAALCHPIDALTEGPLLATVPALLAVLLLPLQQPRGKRPRATSAPHSRAPAEAKHSVRANGLPASVLRLAGPLAVFSAAAVALSLRIPPGNLLCDRTDVMLNVWNHWWFKKALLDPGLSIVHSDYIFQPFGASLLWHTLGPLNCIVGILYQAVSGAGPVSTYNFVALASFALMGWAGYLLGRRVASPSTGFFAGFAIMLCGAHLGQVRAGHLGLANAQWVIFFFLFILRTFERGRAIDAIAAGLFWAASFYTHFYHAIFCSTIFGLVAVAAVGRAAAGSPRIRSAANTVRRALSRRLLLPVIIALAALVFWHPGRWRMWLIVACSAAVLASARAVTAGFTLRRWRVGALPLAVFALAAGPWLVPMFLENLHHGGALSWGRPSSVYAMDLLGYLIPSDISRGGTLFESVWSRFAVPGGDSSAFLGLPVIALAAYGLLRNRKPLWILMAAAFGLLSFGPVLHVLGIAVTRSRMPYEALQAIPLLGAGGVAGRYALPASVALVMIACGGLAHLTERFPSRRSLIAGGAVVAVLLLSYPPLFFYEPPQPGLLQMIKNDPAEGNVLPLCPVDTALWFQTIHEKKMIHGFASRVPREVLDFASYSPVFHELRYNKDLSATREEALETLKHFGVRWIIVAEGRPRGTLEQGLGLRPVAVENDVYLYRVE